MGVFGFFSLISLFLYFSSPRHFPRVRGILFVSLFSILGYSPLLFSSLLMYAPVLLNTGPEVSGEALFFKKESLFMVDVFFFTL